MEQLCSIYSIQPGLPGTAPVYSDYIQPPRFSTKLQRENVTITQQGPSRPGPCPYPGLLAGGQVIVEKAQLSPRGPATGIFPASAGILSDELTEEGMDVERFKRML